jgi:plasmid stabilization system protein ParE
MGRPLPEANRDEVRELIFQGYRIIYRTLPERVQIIAVVHGNRDLAAKERKPWDVV